MKGFHRAVDVSAEDKLAIGSSNRHLARQRSEWEDLAKLDPLWAILSDPRKKFGNWDVADFFETGQAEITPVMEVSREISHPSRHDRVLDFGCGVGRVSRALRRYFSTCVGVDISASMIDAAQRFNAECEFILLDERQLNIFPDQYFDMVYSNIVLQHQPSAAVVFRYIADFLRITKPGGLVTFQLPHALSLRSRLQLRRRAYRALRMIRLPSPLLYTRLKLNPITMLSIPEESMVSAIHSLGGSVLRSLPDSHAGVCIDSRTYYVSR